MRKMLLFIVTSDWGEVVVHNAGINYEVVKDLYCEHGTWFRKLRMDSWVHARLLFPDLQAGWGSSLAGIGQWSWLGRNASFEGFTLP